MAPLTGAHVDVRFINPFIASTRTAFGTTANARLQLGTPFVKNPDEPLHRVYPISVVIDLTGTVSGKVVLSLSEPVSLTVASAMLGQRQTSVNADCRDAIGELANMVVGGAKGQLATGRPITVSLPKVMNTDAVAHVAGRPVLMIPFETATGRFVIQVSMASEAKASAA